jgi:ceramide glucosyltransferase
MFDLGVGLLVLLAFSLVFLMRESQRRLLAKSPPPPPPAWPPVSILKPLKGSDENLSGNLRSFFCLDYPDYELLFGVQDETDEALVVVAKLIGEYPDVPARVVVDGSTVGLNPKVNNLANMARRARHEVLLISDSNVTVMPGYLADLVSHLESPGVGLVSSPIRGVRGTGLGGRIEALQLNTFVMGGVSILKKLRQPCVVGKSMLFRREDLERIGGFPFLGRYLAEDQIFGEAIADLGLVNAVSSIPIDNVLGRLTLAQCAKRHLRWARIRRRMSLPGYVAEQFLNPVTTALLGALALRTPATALIAAATLFATSVLAFRAERDLLIRRPIYHYPFLELARSLMVGVLWPAPFLGSRAHWRGNAFRIGPRTLLTPA